MTEHHPSPDAALPTNPEMSEPTRPNADSNDRAETIYGIRF